MAIDRPDDLVVLTSINEIPPAYLMTLRGSAGSWNVQALQAAFTEAESTGHRLILDLSHLDYGDEVLLGLLLTARATHGITLIGPLAESFHHRLTVTGTREIFEIQPSLTRALANLPR